MKKLFYLYLILGICFGIASGQESLPVTSPATSPVTSVDDVSKIELGLDGSDKEVVEYKNTKKSNINWKDLDVSQVLSFKKWKEETDEKMLYPDWEKIIRERNNKEIIGHFFQCSGTCRIDRAESFFNAQFRANLYEGDEVSTGEDSYAWLYLIDGTIVRLAPESSITLSEINIGIKENFVMARINAGDVLWLSRKELPLKENNYSETDLLFSPISLYDAEPIRDIKKLSEADLFSYLENPQTNNNQYLRLNDLVLKHKNLTNGKKTYAFLVLANITLMGYEPQVEMVSLLGGKSYVKQRTNEEIGYTEKENSELEYQLRGFENKEVQKMEEGKWFEIDEKGRKISEDSEPSLRVVGEFPTKRIPTLMVAREMLMDEYSKICFQEKYDRLLLARAYGYRLWGSLKPENDKKEDLYLRFEFLKEYFRRAETTNLLVSERFRTRLKERGEKTQTMDYGNYFFKRALDKYFDYIEYSDERLDSEDLNSTTKKIWKMMHGLK